MATQVASLEAVLDLDKKAFEKNLKATDKSLDKAKEGLTEFTKVSGKLGVSLGQATNKGRLGLSEIDQGAANAKGSLSSMMGVMGGGAANAAEASLQSVSGNIDKLGTSADDVRSKFGRMGNTLTSRMDKASGSVKDFGKDAGKSINSFVDDLREAAEETEKLADAGEGAAKSFDGIGDSVSSLIPGFDQLASLATPAGALSAVAGAAVAVGTAVISAGMETQRSMNIIQARTGATGEKLEDLGRVAKRVFVSNMGESLEDATNAVIQVNQVLGQTGDAAEDSAKKALTMRDVFGVDIPESLRAVRSANKQFGDETGTTFDMMAATIQRVGDPYQDLADTVNEYSADMAQAGFTQAEFFGILEQGVSQGARNFDVIADALREFTIRIIDGSDKTRNALNELFNATGQGSQEFDRLEEELAATETALNANKEALENSEGAYKAQSDVVSDLEGALSDAQRKLDELSRPNLKGMAEFDDQLFELDQKAKRLQLALLDLDEDTPAFEQTKTQLEAVGDEMDRVALERDLTIEPQLRAIEKAAMEGREPIVSYEEALGNVAAQKDKIAGLETAFNTQTEALEPLANEFERLTEENERLIELQDTLAEKLGQVITPADDLLQKLASGEETTRDSMSAIINMLGDVENQVLADQIAVDLFGSKIEELGVPILTTLDPAVNKMTEFEGATVRAAEAMNTGLGPAISTVGRLIKTSLGIVGEKIISGDIEGLGDILAKGASRIGKAVTSSVDLPGFAEGGIVPGPIGQATPIIAHGGETIVPTGQSGSGAGGVTVIIQGSINGDAHLQQTVMEAFGQLNTALAGGGNR